MKTRIQAQLLQPGDIVGSGEVVLHIIGRALRLPSNKISVTLKKNGHQRTVYWGKYTMIGVEREEKASNA